MDAHLHAVAAIVAREMREHRMTDTTQLNEFGRALFKPGFFLGAMPLDATPPKAQGRAFYIKNTDPATEPGEHWVGVALEPGRKPLLFDSFGRRPTGRFMDGLQHMESTDPDVNQAEDSVICGQLCLAWGLIFERHGRDAAKSI